MDKVFGHLGGMSYICSMKRIILPMKRLFLLIGLLPLMAWSQMTFTYSVEPVSQTVQADGSTLVAFPAGTDLQGIVTAVKVGGKSVAPSAIVPNPTTTLIRDKELETFVYAGQAYSFAFTAPEDGDEQ